MTLVYGKNYKKIKIKQLGFYISKFPNIEVLGERKKTFGIFVEV